MRAAVELHGPNEKDAAAFGVELKSRQEWHRPTKVDDIESSTLPVGDGAYEWRFSRLLTSFILILLLSGCSTYNDKVAATRQSWALGSWEKAAQDGKKLVNDKEGSRDRVLLGLEEGTLLRNIDQLELSQETYDKTWTRIQEMDQEASFQISQAGIALLVNPGMTQYRARTYDRIMLHTYSALNYLNAGDFAAARVSLNRAYNSQQRAVEENSKRIEQVQSEIERGRREDGDQINVSRIENDPVTQRKLSEIYGPTRNMKSYAPYVNPFSVYLDGLFFLNQGVDSSDLERGLKSIERTSSLNPDSIWLRSEFQLAKDIVNGNGQPDSVVILLETGLSPFRESIDIELPLFIFGSGSVPFFAASFPVLRFQPNFPSSASVTVGGEAFQTSLIADIDQVIAQEFNDQESLVITQSIVAAASKAALFYAARSQAKDGSAAQALIDVFGIFYQAITNQPDLRTWFTLPKQIQGVRVPMPSDRKLLIQFAGSNQKVEVSLEEGNVLVVHARVTASANNPVIHQFRLQ
ncbi:MAG: hypothetical protein AAGJ81_07525 [Verrucomicrobiota bacterium]